MPKENDTRPYEYINLHVMDEYAKKFAELKHEGQLAIAGKNSLADQLEQKIIFEKRLDIYQRAKLIKELAKLREDILRDTVY